MQDLSPDRHLTPEDGMAFMTEQLDCVPLQIGSAWSGVTAGLWEQHDLPPSSAKIGFHLVEFCVEGHVRGANRFDALIGSANAEYRPGSLFYVPSGQDVSFWSTGEMFVFQLWIQNKVFDGVKDQMFKGDADRVQPLGFNGWYDPHMQLCVRTILQETQNPEGKTSALMVDIATQQLAIYLLRHAEGAPMAPQRTRRLNESQFKAVTDFIHETLATNVGLTELAGAAGVDPSGFAEAFRTTAGQSVQDYILERRVERAAQMLETSQKSVAEVSCACGFGSASKMVYHILSGAEKTKANSALALKLRETPGGPLGGNEQ